MLSNRIVKGYRVWLIMILVATLSGCWGGEGTAPPETVEVSVVETPVLEVKQVAVRFAYKKTTLSPTAEQELTGLVQQVKDNPSYQIELVGHTDAVASASYNMHLSQQRAEAVRDFLVAQGVTAERMTLAWKGEMQPVAANTTEEGRAQNRRTDVTLRPMTTPMAMMDVDPVDPIDALL